MFCPNCGNDCGEAKFCVKCDTKIEQVEKNTVWSVGMPCPHCGGTQLEGNNCAFCGAQLLDPLRQFGQVNTQEDSYEIPYGLYRGELSDIRLYEDHFVIRKWVLLKKYETEIAYEKITEVRYVRQNSRGMAYDFLIVRWEKNRDLPIPVFADRTSVCVSRVFCDVLFDDLLFYHIYCLLRTLAPATAKFSIEISSAYTEETKRRLAEIDLDNYFERFSPFRVQAVTEICKKRKVTRKQARLLVDKVFDQKQKELYDADPSLAVRDLNRIIKARKNEL